MPLACDYQQALAIESADFSVDQSISMGYDSEEAFQFAYAAARQRLGTGNNHLAIEFAQDAVNARY